MWLNYFCRLDKVLLAWMNCSFDIPSQLDRVIYQKHTKFCLPDINICCNPSCQRYSNLAQNTKLGLYDIIEGNMVHLQKLHLPKVLKFSPSWHGGTTLFAALLTHSAVDQVDPVKIRDREILLSSFNHSFPKHMTHKSNSPHNSPVEEVNHMHSQPIVEILSLWQLHHLEICCLTLLISIFAKTFHLLPIFTRNWPVLGWSQS